MRPTKNGFGAISLLAALGALGGCASSHHAAASGENLKPADFSSGQQLSPSNQVAQAKPPPASPQSTPAQPAPGVQVSGPVAASEGITDVNVAAGPPEVIKGSDPEPVGAPVLIDEKVGDINGRPVFASEFLKPMAARLKARAEDYAKQRYVQVKPRASHPDPRFRPTKPIPWQDAWLLDTKMDIDDRLEQEIIDELLRAEAVASFTPEQKQGFFAYMESVSKRLESENMGSRSAANQRLQGEGGLDQYLRSREELELVNYQLELKLRRRVNVSWRDIKLEYARELARAQAHRQVLIRRIELRADNTAAIDKLKKGLEAGTSFEELAQDPSNLNHSELGGLEPISADATEYFGNKDLNDAAKALAEGATAGPIAMGKYLDWIHRDPDPNHVGPLYSEQSKIEDKLLNTKFAQERGKYLERLSEKTTMTSFDEMTARLLGIAENRYLNPQDH